MRSIAYNIAFAASLLSLAGCGASTDSAQQAAPPEHAALDASSDEATVDAGSSQPVFDITSNEPAIDSGSNLPAVDAGTDEPTIDAKEAASSEPRDTDAFVGDAAGDTASQDTDSQADMTMDAQPDMGTTDYDAASSCSDKKMNGNETDVDCGGSCPPCGPNKGCLIDTDCSATASGCDSTRGGCSCDALSKRCVYNHCFDHKVNGNETSVDCGGDSCSPCALGEGCQIDSDCFTKACDGVSLICVPNQCLDHRQDGKEVDVDCGGPNSCSRCRVGDKCNSSADCNAGHACSTTDPHTCL